MPLPRNYEKEILEVSEQIRAKLSELDLVNAEVNEIGVEHKRRSDHVNSLYMAYRNENDRFNEWNRANLPKDKELAEIRSEIQALQAKCLQICIEFMSREIS